jgi:hypothetical protein
MMDEDKEAYWRGWRDGEATTHERWRKRIKDRIQKLWKLCRINSLTEEKDLIKIYLMDEKERIFGEVKLTYDAFTLCLHLAELRCLRIILKGRDTRKSNIKNNKNPRKTTKEELNDSER